MCGKTFILADNQDITRFGIESFTATLFGADARVALGKSALVAALTECDEAIVILDYTLFDFKGLDDFLVIYSRFRNARWILFSNELSESFLRQVTAQTQVSIILKDSTLQEIETALRSAWTGENYLCNHVKSILATAAAPAEKENLTLTEIEVLRLIAQGKTVKEIAAARFSSNHTIITHKKNIFRKLGVNSVYEATRYALRAGLANPLEYYI